jgi:hypothetical protein
MWEGTCGLPNFWIQSLLMLAYNPILTSLEAPGLHSALEDVKNIILPLKGPKLVGAEGACTL